MRLRIEKMVYGGSGLAHEEEGENAGRAVFVPFTVPGELVEARLSDVREGFAEATLVRVVEGSADRVGPGCVHFGDCGGCQYQHVAYHQQLAVKRGILLETLERAGVPELPEVRVHSAEAWKYRNRIRLRVAEEDGTLRVGYLRRGSAEFLPVRMCPIAAPLLWRAAEAMLKLASEDVDSGRLLRKVSEVELFAAADESRLQMMLFMARDANKDFQAMCLKMRGLIPELVGAGVVVMGPGRKLRAGVGWGAEGLNYEAVGEKYWVGRGSFFQVNRWLVDELVGLVVDERKGLIAWDLYAGVGLFSRALARNFSEVVAVEAAGGDLAKSFKGKGKRAVSATTVDFLRGAVLQRERPELVVMDPPRAGVGAEVCALLTRVSAPEMVYVSCDPVTLARDLKALVESGYSVAELHMVDLFPQTFHLETVVVLRK